jgi:hypothetical protein
VFAALDQDTGTLHVGDTVKIDTLAVQPRPQSDGSEQNEYYPTIWAYNRAVSGEDFRLDDERFWHSTGHKTAKGHSGHGTKKTQ